MRKKSLWKIGLVIVLAGAFINGILIKQNIAGLPREGMRLVILAGTFLFLSGLIMLFFKKNK